MAEYKFSDVFEDVTRKGRKIPANQYLLEGKYPIIDQGKEDVGGYTNAQDGLFTNVPAIIFGDHTRIIKYVDEPFFIGADGVKILEKKVVGADYKYLFYALTHAHIPNTGYNRHFKFLKEVSIPIPDIADQCKIVQQLDLLSSIIDKQLKSLKIYDNLVKSRFVEMFGDIKLNSKKWNIVELEDIADVGSSKRVFVEELLPTGIPFYRGTEIGALAEGKNIVPDLHITKAHYKELCEASGTPQRGDLLMPSICPDGRIWLVDTDEPFYFKDGRVLWVHLTSNEFNNVFVQYVMKFRMATEYEQIASGTTFKELKIFTLKSVNIVKPPIELQNQFADFVALTDKSKLSIQQSIETLQTLKAKLMQEYFG